MISAEDNAPAMSITMTVVLSKRAHLESDGPRHASSYTEEVAGTYIQPELGSHGYKMKVSACETLTLDASIEQRALSLYVRP